MNKFPVPEAKVDGRCVSYTLDSSAVKYIFIDRSAAAEGKPCWMVYIPEDKLVYRASTWSTVRMGGLNVRGRGHKDKPLFPEGPTFWVETTAAIEVTV